MDCQRRFPWQLKMRVEKFQKNFEGPTLISFLFDNRARPWYFLIFHRIWTARIRSASPWLSVCSRTRHVLLRAKTLGTLACNKIIGKHFPSSYAHHFDVLHNRKYDTANSHHMTRPSSPALISTRHPCDNSDHDNGNLTCESLLDLPCALSILFFEAAITHCDIVRPQPAKIMGRSRWRRSILQQETAS